MNKELFVTISCAGVDHHNSDIAALESFRFPDETALPEKARERFKGVVLLQTCNRIEILVQGSAQSLEEFLLEQGRSGFWIMEGQDVLEHLLRLAAGMDSMVVGEDQILGQLKKALSISRKAGTCSPIIDLCIKKAVHVGIEVRKRTNINNGAVSIGSAAVQLAEELIGSLKGKHILVVGSGEMGTLVTQALAAKDLTAIYVANRTYERAVSLADEIGGKAVRFDSLYRYISLSDVVITCTGAPHPVIHCDPLCDVLKERLWPLDAEQNPLIIIDIAQPRDVEDCVCEIKGLHVFTIDDLRSVSEKNLKNRKKEAELSASFLDTELEQFISLINRNSASDMLAHMYTWAEAIRIRERDRALSRLKGSEAEVAEVIDDFTRVLVKKLLVDVTYSVRSSTECGEIKNAGLLVKAITEGEKVCFRKED